MRDHLTQSGSKQTPQSEPIPGRESDMAENKAGGYGFKIDKWTQFRRFLFLGTEGGTYYTTERELTRENARAARACIDEDGTRAVEMIREIADSGRAPHQDPLLFALAMAISEGDEETRRAAGDALSDVAQYSTHLFHFKTFAESFRGYGRVLRRAIADWYTEKDADYIAYQAAKYPSRDGESHADLLNVSHPKPPTDEHDKVFGWIVNEDADPPTDQVAAMQKITAVSDVDRAVELIREHRLTHEMVASDLKSEPEVWEALLKDMPIHATLRNLGNLSAHGVLSTFSDAAELVTDRLTDPEHVQNGYVHPLDVVTTYQTYQSGSGYRGSKTWDPVTEVLDALSETFRLSFENVEPTGQRLIVGVDKSGSMGSSVSGLPQLEAVQGALIMAMATVYAEDRVEVLRFDSTCESLGITGSESLNSVLNVTRPGGGTNVASPINWAIENGVEADAILLYTDMQTWAGHRHPTQALDEYRRTINPDAKLVGVDMTAEQTTVGDPDDSNTLGVVGFDSRTPQAISAFLCE